MPEARVPRLQLAEAKAAADEAGVPDYMAELSIFQAEPHFESDLEMSDGAVLKVSAD